MKTVFLSLLLITLLSCSSSIADTKLPVNSNWLFQLDIDNDNVIPFNVEVKEPNNLVFRNAEEKIEVTNVSYKQDSIFVVMPVFGSEFKGKIEGDIITGNWYNYNKTDYSIPFEAKQTNAERFTLASTAGSFDFSGRHKVEFLDDEGNITNAIGVFNQKADNRITGTFLTETGDYRYLEGNVAGDEMKLSTFDGAHAFLFTAKAGKDGVINGSFYSGHHWLESWKTIKDETPNLGDADKLTYLLPGHKTIEFSFKNTDGELVEFPNEQTKNKAVILQIFGTWCPNCMDETRYFTELYKRHKKDGLEIIALDFEPKPEFDYFQARAKRFKKDLGVTYPVLFAGPSDKKKAVKSLPMLNKIYSYPTSIFIGKDGSVRKMLRSY